MFLFQEEETPLIAAAWHDYARICRILCSAGADLNIRNKVTIEWDWTECIKEYPLLGRRNWSNLCCTTWQCGDSSNIN